MLNIKRLLIVFLLGFSSGVPLALITSTLQAWFADTGMSVLVTGMLSLVGLPYVGRMLWGPLLDRYSLTPLGKRRSWIIITQLSLFIGFNVLSWLSPTQSPYLMAGIALILAVFSATQDIAIDAQRIEYLPKSAHALGASLAVTAYRLAMLITGGIALILAQHYGWTTTYRLMGLLMLPGILATLLSQEPASVPRQKIPFLRDFIAPVHELFSRPIIIPLIFFIFFYKLGEAFTATSSGIVMPFLIQGLRFSLETIGYINKILGVAALLAGGIAAGILLIRWSLYRALLWFGLLQALTNLLFALLAITGKNIVIFAIAVVSDNFAAGMGSTALVALFMHLVNRQYTATQFSILVALSMVPRVFSGPLAALLQIYLGWTGLYELSFFLALGFIPFLMRLKNDIQVSSEEANIPNSQKSDLHYLTKKYTGHTRTST